MAKYTGKYKNLMPAGYTFLKMYARNYRTYRFECSINDSMWIFQKGNDIEILDFYAKSGFLVKSFVKNRDRLSELYEDDFLRVRMDTKTGKLRHYDLAERRHAWKIETRLYERLEKTENKAAIDLYYKKWKTGSIPKKMVEEVLRLWDAGVIELVEKEFPEK
jgi:hypothetical protein